KNFSYQHVYKQKDEYADTLITVEKYTLLKAPEAKETGYFFKKEAIDSNKNVVNIILYNGKDLLGLDPADSTYDTKGALAMVFGQTLVGELNMIKSVVNKNPSKFIQLSDTTYNGVNSYHLVLTTRDTIVNKEHIYGHIHLLIDKATDLPVGKFIKARTGSFGKVENYYTAESFFNYKINNDDINAASFNI